MKIYKNPHTRYLFCDDNDVVEFILQKQSTFKPGGPAISWRYDSGGLSFNVSEYEDEGLEEIDFKDIPKDIKNSIPPTVIAKIRLNENIV